LALYSRLLQSRGSPTRPNVSLCLTSGLGEGGCVWYIWGGEGMWLISECVGVGLRFTGRCCGSTVEGGFGVDR
jgi:hypothetical protein